MKLKTCFLLFFKSSGRKSLGLWNILYFGRNFILKLSLVKKAGPVIKPEIKNYISGKQPVPQPTNIKHVVFKLKLRYRSGKKKPQKYYTVFWWGGFFVLFFK